MVIGFATTCMNRRWQLEQTLADTLRALAGTPHFVALVDFNSADDVEGLLARFRGAIEAGSLLAFRTTLPRSFHMSVAKNTAHRLALRRRPDVLFNLDCDNRAGPETIALVEEVFGRHRDSCLHNWSGDWGTGTSGRVALAAERWQELGGYDEGLLPVGWQDLDLLYRARLLGLRYERHGRGVGLTVSNSYRDKIANVELPAGLFPAGADPGAAYVATLAPNIVAALGRPVRLRVEDQQRFEGVLDLGLRGDGPVVV